jgi:hypothetical protein
MCVCVCVFVCVCVRMYNKTGIPEMLLLAPNTVNGSLAVHQACAAGHTACLKYLVERAGVCYVVRVCVYVCVCVCMCVCVCVRACVRAWSMYVYTNVCIVFMLYVCVYVCVCVYIQLYI